MQQYLIEPRPEGPFSLTKHKREIPSPGPGEVLVRMRAASLNYRDLLVRSGKSASGGGVPVVPLSDGAGEIVEIGKGVTDWSVGDRVALTFFRDWLSGAFDMSFHAAARGGSCDGVLSEFVAAPSHSLVRVPRTLTWEEASTLPCAALTAWHALMERGRPVAPGETVLCLGTGGVSVFALQFAKAAGATVLITSRSDEKLARASKLGADVILNYDTTPDWDREVWNLTKKRGVDRVIEVGGPGTVERSLNSVAAGGIVSLIGVLTGFSPAQANLFTLVKKCAELHGIYVGHREMFVRMNEFIEKHDLHPVLDRVFSFEDAPSAYDRIESGEHLGKVVVSCQVDTAS